MCIFAAMERASTWNCLPDWKRVRLSSGAFRCCALFPAVCVGNHADRILLREHKGMQTDAGQGAIRRQASVHGRAQIQSAHRGNPTRVSWWPCSPVPSVSWFDPPRRTLWAHASGLPYKWKNFWPDHVQCQLAYNRNGFEVNSQNQRLILAQFSPAFAILFIGYVISTIVFIGERCRKPESTHRKNQQGRIPVWY